MPVVRMLSLVLAMLVSNCGAPMVAHAAPAATSKTRAFEGKIEIDPRLADYPALYALLLAEGRRALAEQRREAEETRRSDPAAFGRVPWSLHRAYRLRADTARYVSLIRIDDTYSGGAHPNRGIVAVLWDKQAEQMGSAFSLFADLATGGPTLTTLAGAVRAALAQVKKKRGIEVAADPAADEWLKEVGPDREKLGEPSLAPSTLPGKASGMTFHFAPYAVGPYAEGSFTAFVPASVLAPLLKPEARALFAGNRPAADARED